ncbi:uncharacterized protein [Ranitomeya imitator]|uniref:uncharacterized protein n=1 Tax=Ranitomeya imitator TaxID=111125 RepID=UPI0037E72CB0
MNESRQRAGSLCERWEQLGEDFGCTQTIEHEIPTGDTPPIRERYRQIPPALYQEVKSMVASMLDNQVIRESRSPWAAPVVLVRKKDGTLRFCVDYRKLNAHTVRDAYPLPRIEESLSALGRAKYFSTLDLASGYWQVPMAEKDRAKTAFVLPMGLFEFNRMPFGLATAPGTFQRLMEHCLGDLNFESVLIYLDDIVVFGTSFEDHLEKLRQVLRRLKSYGLKIKPKKCQLLRNQIEYLGHLVTPDGVLPLASNIKAVQEWPPPCDLREVRAFLGLAGYYRRFVPKFSQVVSPLNELLRGTALGPRNRPIPWGPLQKKAFDGVKTALTSAPLLAYARFDTPFLLYTDGSLHGLGAVLAQVQDGRERVISYGSRSLRDSERNPANYSSFRLELLALVWAMTERFAEYLTGAEVLVMTDNNPLAHLENAKLGALEQRWVARLAKFNYRIKFRSGRENGNADALVESINIIRLKVNTLNRDLFAIQKSRLFEPAAPINWPDTATATAPIMPLSMPYIPGAAWLPQYSGESHTLNDFKERLCSLFEVHPLTEHQKILKGQLIGAALGEVKSYPDVDKRTVQQIIAKLKVAFDTCTAAEIKMKFFGCKQKAQDSIRDYSLSLQKALRAVNQVDPNRIQDGDKLLKEQFIEGLLLSNTHRTQLRILALQNPDLEFAQFKDRAIRVLHEPPPSCAVPLKRPGFMYPQEVASYPQVTVEADAHVLDEDSSTGLGLQVQELTKSVAAIARTIQSLQESPKEKMQLASRPEDVPCIPMNALLDTSSQVTTMPYILYKRYWADTDITRGPDSDLTIVASNGKPLPQVGYKEVTIKVGQVELKAQGMATEPLVPSNQAEDNGSAGQMEDWCQKLHVSTDSTPSHQKQGDYLVVHEYERVFSMHPLDFGQVPIAEADKEKTAFTTLMGLAEFNYMPFGLCNTPGTFQRMMECCLGHKIFKTVLLYLDDVIVFSKTYEDHLRHLAKVFEALSNFGLKVKPSKCHLLKSKVQYLGHVVSSEGVAPDPDKVTVIKNWPKPSNLHEVRQFLGLVGYYRRFIKDFTKIATPLQDLLVSQSKKTKGKNITLDWNNRLEGSFTQLKLALMGDEVLAYPEYDQPFVLYTDASNTGFGAVLSQVQKGKERVIAYASRKLRPTERNPENYSSLPSSGQ